MRVFKHFLKNMLWPVGLSGGYLLVGVASGYAAEWLGYEWIDGFMIVPIVLTIVSFIGFLIYSQWDLAREQVKLENEDIIKAVKDD